jgi:HlyD family secretion protein
VASAEVQLAAAAVEVSRAELAKTVLSAPFDAVVADVSVEVGEWVTPSVPLVAAPDLIDAIDSGSLYISAPMDEVDALLLRVDQRARVTIDSHAGRAYQGHVVRLAPYVLDVEQQNRTIEIEVELDDAELASTLLPGTSADVELILEVREGVLRIPSHALMEGGRVLLVEQSELVERLVETGLRNWDWTEITSGLLAGDEVVTSLDLPDLAAGARVVVEALEQQP